MAKSLSQLIQLFETDSLNHSENKKSSDEQSLAIELQEAQELFDSRLEEQGDLYHVNLKVRIAELKCKIAKQNTVMLTEQSRSLSARKPQEIIKEESITDIWQLPFYAEYDSVVDREGKKVCDCETEEIAKSIANLLNIATQKEYEQQKMARVKTDMALGAHRNPEKSWMRPRK